MVSTEKHQTNSRLEELDFLISIMTDLSLKYEGHNKNLLSELISTLNYRKEKEELISVAKYKSKKFSKKKY